MDWFFEQFIFAPGHPVLDVSSTWNATAGEIRLDVSQVQDRHHGVPIYKLPVQIGIITSSGKRVEEVWLEHEHDSFVFPSSEEPLLVRFDEGNWLLKEWTFEKSVEELLYQTRHDDVIGREWAVRGLAEFGDGAGVFEELSAIVFDDPFWAVRLAAIETVASVSGRESIEVLRAAATDTKSQVRSAAVRLLGGFEDASLVQFFRDRFDADSSYQAQAEALRAIGHTGDRNQLGFLREASGMESPRDVIRLAAEWAIEEISGER
jgi:aminopeptidase N